jgi:branched-chain amino acid transport system substrate-binding protein
MFNSKRRNSSGKYLFFMATLLVLGLSLQAVFPKETIAESLKLGLIDMYTGSSAFSANSIKAGFEIAVEETNAAGGVVGITLEVKTADMAQSTEKAITEIRRMVLDEKISYVTIGIHSGAAVAAARMAPQMKFLLNGAFATTKRLTGEAGSRYVCRGNISTVEIGATMADFLKNKPQVKSISTISPDYEYGQHLIADFKAQLTKIRPDIKIIREEWPKLGTSDYTPHVTALQATIPDLLVGGIFGGDLLNFLKASRDFGLDKKTRFFWHAMGMEFEPIKDIVPEGTWSTIWYPFYHINNPLNTKFQQEFKKKLKTYPDDNAIVGYYSAKMMVEAMKKAGTVKLESVIDALGGSKFEAPTGLVKVRECDKMALIPFYVGVVKRDPKFPGGVGFADVKSFDIEKMARPCEEVMKDRVKK